MSEIAAVFYDGRTSVPRQALLHFDADGMVRLSLVDGEHAYPIDAIRICDRIGANSPRVIEFPDGALAHVAPHAETDARLDAIGGSGRGLLRRLESRWPHALAALVTCVLLVTAFVKYGMPALAAVVADRIPLQVERQIGDQTLQQLDKIWFEPTRLDAARRQQLHQAFHTRIASQSGFGVSLKLEFRSSGEMGPNAFALPGGIVVVTDELIEFAKHDDEILAVLAHETGHVVGRHSLRQGLEGLGITLLMTAVTGDLSGPASIAAALPALLLQSGYSRRDEREADAYAFTWSDANGVSRTRMTDLLLRIDAKYGSLDIPTLLSTHPSSNERVQAARPGG